MQIGAFFPLVVTAGGGGVILPGRREPLLPVRKSVERNLLEAKVQVVINTEVKTNFTPQLLMLHKWCEIVLPAYYE